MSLLVSNSIPKTALKKMPSVCAEILQERGIAYFESLELFTEELRDMSSVVFKDSVIDMVAFNPQEFESATWLFQEAFCRIYSDLSEAMLFELSQTASDLVENLQDYFLNFKKSGNYRITYFIPLFFNYLYRVINLIAIYNRK